MPQLVQIHHLVGHLLLITRSIEPKHVEYEALCTIDFRVSNMTFGHSWFLADAID